MEFLVPIAICAIMPISIVFLVFMSQMNADNKRAKILIKAIEANNNIDADKLAAALEKPKKTAREILNGRMLRGCVFSFMGIAAGVLGIVFTYSIGDRKFAALLYLAAGACIAIGLGFLVTYFVTRKEN